MIWICKIMEEGVDVEYVASFMEMKYTDIYCNNYHYINNILGNTSERLLNRSRNKDRELVPAFTNSTENQKHEWENSKDGVTGKQETWRKTLIH